MEAIFFALITYFGWGSGDIFGAIASRKIGAYTTTFYAFFIGVLLFTLYVPFALNDLSHITLPLFIFNLLLGLCAISGNVAINEAYKSSNASVVGAIAASFTALTVILSVIFLGDKINFSQVASIIIIFAGVILTILDWNEIKKGNLIKDKGIRLALFCMVVWAIYFTFIKIPINHYGWFWPNYISFLLFPLIYVYMRWKKLPFHKPTHKNAFLPIFLSALLLRGGDFSINFAFTKGLTAVVAPIAGAYPTLFVVLAFFIFKDPIKKQQIVGIIITLTGIILLSFLSR